MNCPNCDKETSDKDLWVLHKPNCKKAVTGYARHNYSLSPCRCGSEVFCETCAFDLNTKDAVSISYSDVTGKYGDAIDFNFSHNAIITPSIPVSLSKVLEAHDRYLLEYQEYDSAYRRGNAKAKKAYEKNKSSEWFMRFEVMVVKYIQKYFIGDDDDLHFELWKKHHDMRQSFIDLAKARREQ